MTFPVASVATQSDVEGQLTALNTPLRSMGVSARQDPERDGSVDRARAPVGSSARHSDGEEQIGEPRSSCVVSTFFHLGYRLVGLVVTRMCDERSSMKAVATHRFAEGQDSPAEAPPNGPRLRFHAFAPPVGCRDQIS